MTRIKKALTLIAMISMLTMGGGIYVLKVLAIQHQ